MAKYAPSPSDSCLTSYLFFPSLRSSTPLVAAPWPLHRPTEDRKSVGQLEHSSPWAPLRFCFDAIAEHFLWRASDLTIGLLSFLGYFSSSSPLLQLLVRSCPGCPYYLLSMNVGVYHGTGQHTVDLPTSEIPIGLKVGPPLSQSIGLSETDKTSGGGLANRHTSLRIWPWNSVLALCFFELRYPEYTESQSGLSL